MKKRQDNSRSTAFKLLTVVVFVGVLVFFINNLYTGEPDTTLTAFSKQAQKFERHTISSHYQWRVRQPTSMIMLIHFDDTGSEIDRKPVRMNHKGWPSAQNSDEGCATVWTSLVGSPLRVDGFNVKARFYSTASNDEAVRRNDNEYWCRYSISKGVEFDYYPGLGKVTKPQL